MSLGVTTCTVRNDLPNCFLLLDFELTIVNSSGFGTLAGETSCFSISSNVCTVLSRGRGRKNMVPLHALSEL